MADEILTDADYEKALAEVIRLWGSAQGTEDGDRLSILIPLVSDYEAEHFPLEPPRGD